MAVQSGVEKTLSVQTGGSYLIEIPVRWGDLDALNHVNNTVYFRYMEEARVQCARACNIGAPGSGRDIVLAHVTCDFLRPILWPATVRVDTKLVKVGRSSVEFEVEMSVKGEEGVCARSRNVIVGVDPLTGRPAPWTDAELEGLQRVFAS